MSQDGIKPDGIALLAESLKKCTLLEVRDDVHVLSKTRHGNQTEYAPVSECE